MRSGLLDTISWRALMAPETGIGSGDDGGGAPPAGVVGDAGGEEGGEAPERRAPDQRSGQRERKSVRQELESAADEYRRNSTSAEGEQPRKSGRFAPKGAGRGAQEGEAPAEGAEAGAEAAAAAAAGAAEGEAPAEGAAAPTTSPPGPWSKEARAEWAKVPPAVQTAVLKREADVQKGVDALKAHYSDIETALQPHSDVIKRHGHTPAQAVSQLFAWFQALAQNPAQAFPALAKSFGYQLPSPAATTAAPGATPAAGTEQAPVNADGEISPAVQRYVDSMLQQVGGVLGEYGQKLSAQEQYFKAQNEAKTHDVLNTWSKDKPHFERVRATMAQLIASGAVPLVDGRVDLDGAYNKALWLSDDTRAELLAKQEADRVAAAKAKAAAEAKAQADKAAAARNANVSLSPTAPGTDPSRAAAGKRKKGESVRESIQRARQELAV